VLIFLVNVIKKLFYGLDAHSSMEPKEPEVLFFKRCEDETLRQIDLRFKGQGAISKLSLENFRDDIQNLLKRVVLSLIKFLFESKNLLEFSKERMLSSFELIIASKCVIFENQSIDFLGCLIYQLWEFICR
jgi:hypothetical protein